MLDLILKLCDDMPPTENRRAFFVKSYGGGQYHITECDFKTEPPALHEFSSDIGDTIAIWSTNKFLSKPIAHEIAIAIGNEIGWYV